MISDYFAELFVAGLFADNDWNVYFPHRDKGFDFIISKRIGEVEIIRPVQVKGKYPTDNKTDKSKYGYIGELTRTHEDMILAIPYFNNFRRDGTDLIAFMPFHTIKPHSKGFRCEPAMFKNGFAIPRRDYRQYFGDNGLVLLEENLNVTHINLD